MPCPTRACPARARRSCRARIRRAARSASSRAAGRAGHWRASCDGSHTAARRGGSSPPATCSQARLMRLMAAPPTEHEILDVNRRYHDVAADSYDAKWGISFGEIGHQQVLGKITKLLGPRPGPFAHSLEIGAGTGYFSLNLLQTGVIANATC